MTDLTATPLMLRPIPFFQGLDGQALEALAPSFRVEHRRRGCLLAGRDARQLELYENTVYFVSQGVVALFTRTRTGARKIVFFLGAGQLLSHSVLATRPCTLLGEVIADAVLLATPRDSFQRLVARTPALSQALLRHYETDLWRMSHQLKNTAGYLPVERKLAIKLQKLGQEFGRDGPQGRAIPFPLTITQLADFVGVPRETASRCCGRLGELGLLRYEKRRFLLPDLPRLAAYCRDGRV